MEAFDDEQGGWVGFRATARTPPFDIAWNDAPPTILGQIHVEISPRLRLVSYYCLNDREFRNCSRPNKKHKIVFHFFGFATSHVKRWWPRRRWDQGDE